MAIAIAPLIDDLRDAQRLPNAARRRAIRLASGATQQQVADALECDRVTVARWEAGAREPTGPLRVRYVRLLDQLRSVIDPISSDAPAVAAEASQMTGKAVKGASPP